MLKLDVNEKQLREKMKVLFGKKMSQNIFANKYLSVYRGKGLEFENFRDYNIGDDADMIDWKASRRANKLIVREYTTEKEIDVLFLFDIGSTMYYSSQDKLKVETAIEIILVLSYLAMESGTKVGIVMFSDEVKVIIPFSRGNFHGHKITKILLDPKNYEGGKSNLVKAFLISQTFIRENTVIFLVSDFLNYNSTWNSILSIMDFRYDVVGLMIRDRRDRNIPEKGFLRVVNSATNEELILNTDSAAKEYNYIMKKNEDEIAQHFLAHKSDFLLLETGGDFFHPLLKFLKRRSSKFR